MYFFTGQNFRLFKLKLKVSLNASSRSKQPFTDDANYKLQILNFGYFPKTILTSLDD